MNMGDPQHHRHLWGGVSGQQGSEAKRTEHGSHTVDTASTGSTSILSCDPMMQACEGMPEFSQHMPNLASMQGSSSVQVFHL